MLLKRILPALSLGFLLWGCSYNPETEAETEPVVTVDVAPVLSSTIQLKVGANALLYPLQQAAIVPKVQAPVKKFYVERGSQVRAGQLLAELENRDLAGAVAEAQAAHDQANANYETTAKATVPEETQKAELDVKAGKDALDNAQRLYDSRQNLFKEGAIAEKDVKDAQVALTQAQNQYDIARTHLQSVQRVSMDQSIKGAAAQRDAAKARLDSAEAQLSYSRITSPINGVVTDRPVFAGEMPPSGAPLITVMDISQVIARAHVSQQDAAQVKVGNPANIFPLDGSAPVAGKVTVVSPALDPANTTVEIWIQAPNTGGVLKPGTSLQVEVIAKTAQNALIIPEQAVLTRPSGNTAVITVDAENKPEKKTVMLGIHDAGMVQVVSGLMSGDRVVTAGVFELDKLDEDVLAKTKLQIAPPKEEEEEDEQ
jgi:multidrug efflux pump subunit AcrA (membrane-fusion protein)